MNLIDALFARLRSQGRKAFMPFVTAGDPDLASTAQVVQTLVQHGADLIEIGFPYSDPIADGPVIQASYTRALNKGLLLEDIFATIQQLANSAGLRDKQTPLVGMVSYSLVHRRQPAQFVQQAKASGLAGLIVPDLPVEEADELGQLAGAADLKLILLTTPTTPRDRALRIAQAASGFLYCVSVTGITGERDRIPETLLDELRWLRQQTSLPLCVGFGISKPEHVQTLREVADGIIVGSALVRKFEQVQSLPKLCAELGEFTKQLLSALNP